jgi:preprotein translocase subunit SecG
MTALLIILFIIFSLVIHMIQAIIYDARQQTKQLIEEIKDLTSDKK